MSWLSSSRKQEDFSLVDCLVDLSLPTKLVVLTRTSVLLLQYVASDEDLRLCLKVCSHFEPSFVNYVTSNDFFKSSMTLFYDLLGVLLLCFHYLLLIRRREI